MKSRYLLWALRAHRHVTPDAYAYANSKYIGAQTHGKQGMSALREVLVTHDVSETVRTYLNARGIVHTKRTCKTAAANVSEASSTEMAHPRRAQCVHTTGPRAASHADGLLRGSLGFRAAKGRRLRRSGYRHPAQLALSARATSSISLAIYVPSASGRYRCVSCRNRSFNTRVARTIPYDLLGEGWRIRQQQQPNHDDVNSRLHRHRHG